MSASATQALDAIDSTLSDVADALHEQVQGDVLDRIASALERIADALGGEAG
ncbi:hypothetical protein [Mobilicoccus sp.]|uniref:hypothetical protein n=1 Tax=Mobilicoccus sp. TaxID=2034349 RepID=UPI0028A9C6AB|nr:hypothetical protein [Mobilicoccus sp.]